ncbi:Yip1 domain [Sesbania bispinosa]|nr:Yip1 domain [Sesbania bispinosa]
MEESSYTGLPTSHLLGSVPAVITEEDNNTTKHVDVVPGANMQIFPPTNGGDRGRGYQTLSSPTEAFEQQPTNNWRGVFSVSSYSQYFNVDTDDVVTRLISSLNPVGGDFFSKIDANPDLYGLIWISTTLVFVLASLGNLATFLMQKHADNSTSWSFDVSYMNMAACSIYGYAIVVPLAYYFFLQYMGSNASLIRFWCMWGYSLTIFIVSSEKLAGAVPQQSEALLHHRSKDLPDRTHIPNHASTIYKGWIKFLLIIPVEILRWLIILVTGVASASFVALNLRSYIDGNDLSVAIIAAFLLQIALAVFIKVWFFA